MWPVFAFAGRPDKMGVAADYSTSDRHSAGLDRLNADLNRGTVFVPGVSGARYGEAAQPSGPRALLAGTSPPRCKPTGPRTARASSSADVAMGEYAGAEPDSVTIYAHFDQGCSARVSGTR